LTRSQQKYLTAKEVSELRRKTEAALTKERQRGDGPPWVKDNGRVLYPEDELEQWLAERVIRSEPATP
jgi:hypothetical protein